MGTIGTAPELEALSALTPFDHGGNMDVPDVKPGNTVYLPVRVPGALFFTGDCHAGQGQGELCGVALEITARVTVTFDLIKGKAIAWPRIESADELMTVGSARPMEDAARIAYAELDRLARRARLGPLGGVRGAYPDWRSLCRQHGRYLLLAGRQDPQGVCVRG